MATKTKVFFHFGVKYRTRQFAAVRALELATNTSSKIQDVLDVLEQTEVFESGEWIPLDSRESVNRYVVDPVGMLIPQLVLKGLLDIVGDLSCGIVKNWHGVKVPNRFTSEGLGIPTRESEHVDPVIAALLSGEAATLRELEEYYSLHDAMKMFDVMVAKGVNEALANEHAQKANR